jgi:hypothetical protein
MRRAVRRCPALLLALAITLLGVAAHAEGEAVLSPLERATVARALRSRRLEETAAADGRKIEAIEVYRIDVFDDTDPVPDFFNVFHTTTLEPVIRRELLFEVGDPWDRERIKETARNLRGLEQLSVVLIVPVRGTRPDRVRVLVITKDVWSLRLNSAFQYFNGYLTELSLQPSETNAFGTHTIAAMNLGFKPDTFSGLQRRVAGSRIAASGSANVIVNRDTGDAEGSFGSYSYGKPLWSRRTRWAWNVTGAWRRNIFRGFVGPTLRTFDADATPEDDRIPYVYDAERYYGSAEITRSFGEFDKLDVTIGGESTRQAFRTRDLAPSPARGEFVREVLPVRDQRLSPFLQLRVYSTRFESRLNVNTLSLQEDFRFGHDLLVRSYAASTELGSSRDVFGTYGSVGYTLPLGDGLVRAVFTGLHERALRGRRDGYVGGSLRIISPSFALGRIVFDGDVLYRYDDWLNEKLTLGGDGRLRGYAPQQFIGSSAAVSNVELRTRPVQILSAQVGGAIFYDSGGVWGEDLRYRTRHAAGLGLRIVFPQADRTAVRADWGFPLGDDRLAPFPGSFFVSFDQAFPMPAVAPPLNSLLAVPRR